MGGGGSQCPFHMLLHPSHSQARIQNLPTSTVVHYSAHWAFLRETREGTLSTLCGRLCVLIDSSLPWVYFEAPFSLKGLWGLKHVTH